MKIDKRVKRVAFNTKLDGRRWEMNFVTPFKPKNENEARALAIKFEVAILEVVIEGMKALGEK